ncbi:hypothetical protein BDW59DRAFT_157079 [Aspergillus cavernicola]|uniref:Erythromycin biosynthesis protein CIII-like C-terminal domain-containing protein n=1 Tax=Aspergillus cavernicola TaxID=176166 RepID=A0ABR4IYS2_9EURO
MRTPGMTEVISWGFRQIDHFASAHGLADYFKILTIMEAILSPWDTENYVDLFTKIMELIAEVDPAVIVVDSSQYPFVIAARNSNCLFAMLNLTAITNAIGFRQPWGAMFWKYLVPGYQGSHNMHMQWDDVPLLSGDLPEAGLLLSYYPPNVTVCGPMVLDTPLASEEHPELRRAIDMSVAVLRVLQESSTQVIWKFEPEGKVNDGWRVLLQRYIDRGRLRIETRPNVDPASLVKTGKIDVWVHHGGAATYHEAVIAGVKQVILPRWLDTYNYAQMAEYVGVGIWLGKKLMSSLRDIGYCRSIADASKSVWMLFWQTCGLPCLMDLTSGLLPMEKITAWTRMFSCTSQGMMAAKL